MTIVVAVLGVLLAVALLFVTALLRSHAEILRRLAGIEQELYAGAPGDAGSTRAAGAPALGRNSAGGRATDINGQTVDGDAVKLSLGPRSPATLLAFMGTSCTACLPLWEGLKVDAADTPRGLRLVVVTKGPERERLARLLELVPAQTEVVMSTQAWSDFAVPSTPHFVLVRDGAIAGRGSATSWQQIKTFVDDADDDDRVYRARALGTNARAERAERALADAGIGPADPSLYPSRFSSGLGQSAAEDTSGDRGASVQ